MSDLVSLVSAHLLAPGDLSIELLPDVLAELAGPGIDAADLYFQSQISENWVLEDGIVKEGSFNLDQGVGVRAQSGEKTGFAYSNTISRKALSDASQAARSIARAGQSGRVETLRSSPCLSLYPAVNPLEVLGRAEKVDLLKRIDAATRSLDSRIQQVTVQPLRCMGSHLGAASDGSLGADVRPLVRLNVSVIVEQHGRREQGSSGGGGRAITGIFWKGTLRRRSRHGLCPRSGAAGAGQSGRRAGAGGNVAGGAGAGLVGRTAA